MPEAAGQHDGLFQRLSRSSFRSKFKLAPADIRYITTRGRAAIEQHAADFIVARLAAASPRNDGRQTPLRGHPVFTAQHATATCCRGCIAKWHGIPENRELTAEEQQRLAGIIMAWLDREMGLAHTG